MDLLCDLHVHSNCSDGSCSPTELINVAIANGISVVALCDHNTISGLSEFISATKNTTVTPVSGIEISTTYKGKEVHVLGLFIKKEYYAEVTEYLNTVNLRKIEGNKQLAACLIEGGYNVDLENIIKNAKSAIPNRMHFAVELMDKGYVSSINEAFDGILAEGGGFYKPCQKLNSIEVIEFLVSIGAVPVVAHPLLSLSVEELNDFLPEAKKCGLVGMETIYSEYSKDDMSLADSLARKYDLLPSGGSDFHGVNKPDIKMGMGKDNLIIPFEIFENLKRQQTK